MLNASVLMGRLVADPELRHTSSDIAVTSFTIAVDRDYQKAGAERQADFIDIIAWRSSAEFVCKYFRKGQLIAVQGSIQTRMYQDKDGNKRKAFEIVADKVSFCGNKSDSTEKGQGRSYQTATSAPNINPDPGDFQEIPTDDDLPF
ncbi:single-stranded DNA-binding protein [Clostridium merdae]|uniref:single-stranded DNA-binding protein n=1 Tax=Clostridium merdae TaxID=1958780 RepID=UPI000A267E79|nr:single-stranded DNA-binding protein [Clostridium merdae]